MHSRFAPTATARLGGSNPVSRIKMTSNENPPASWFNLKIWRYTMDWNRVEGNWKEFRGKVKEKWGKLTDDDLTAINGKRDQLEGRLQQRYGFAKDQVRKDIDSWFSALK
jgi:uncharacterized protein YjbJ (UPF0337 family)